MYKGVDTGGALGASAPPDFEAQYVLYIGIRVFVVLKVPTKVEIFYKSCSAGGVTVVCYT